MTSLWLALAGLLFLAVIFIVWPMWRYKNTAAVNSSSAENASLRLGENVRIFREHLSELENNLASGAIDSAQFAQLKLELERNLLEDEASLREQHASGSLRFGAVKLAIFFGLVLLGGLFLYQKFGAADDLAIKQLQAEKNQQDYQDMLQNRDPDPARARELAEEYKARLKAKPDSLQYWYLLARTQLELGEYAQAVASYQEILNRDSQSPVIMAEMGQAMFLADGNKMSPVAVDLAKGAVALDPRNTMALGLLGIDAFGRKDYREAIRHWQAAIQVLGAQSQGAQALASGVEKAKQAYVAEGGKLEDLSSKSPYTLKLAVNLGPKVKVDPNQVVFIYARAWKGSPMPLAIKRLTVADLPTTIELDETMAMSPATSLATASDIEVVARISGSGSNQASVGDWQASQGPISMKSIPEQIPLEINTQLAAEALGPR